MLKIEEVHIYFFVCCALDRYCGTGIINSIYDLIYQILGGYRYNKSAWFTHTLLILTVVVFILWKMLGKRRTLIVLAFMSFFSLYLQYEGVLYWIKSEISWPNELFGYEFNESWVTTSILRCVILLPYVTTGLIFNCSESIKDLIIRERKLVIGFGIISLILLFNTSFFIQPQGDVYQGIRSYLITIAVTMVFYCLPMDRIPYSILNIISKISGCTMGIYYIHRLINYIVWDAHFGHYIHLNQRGAIYTVFVFLVCLAICLPFGRFKNKYIKCAFI